MDKCANCSSNTGPFYVMHWDSVGETELYCRDCYDRNTGEPLPLLSAETILQLTDSELESIIG